MAKLISIPANQTLSAPAQIYAVGIDIGSEKCSFSVLSSDKSVVIKPLEMTNDIAGYDYLMTKLESLALIANCFVIGLEATGRYWENLYHRLQNQGYQMLLLHPAQTPQFAQRLGLRAKTDRLDAVTIARVVLSGDARPAYVPSELVATYRELVRLHSNLADEIGRYRNEIRDLLVVLFPEFTQVFADPCRPTALAILKLYSNAQAFATTNLEELTLKMQEFSNGHYALKTAQQLIELASHSATSGLAHTARSTGLVILCDQLLHTQHNLAQLEAEIENLMQQDQAAVTLEKIPEFGPKTVAGLTKCFINRSQLNDLTSSGTLPNK